MQHSYEALDRGGGFSSTNLLAPLRHRDFRVMWTGMTVSMLGDGMFLVAMPGRSTLSRTLRLRFHLSASR